MLLKNGVPFDVAESWPDSKRHAYYIIFNELETGLVFNFSQNRYEKA